VEPRNEATRQVLTSVADLDTLRTNLTGKQDDRPIIALCAGTGCRASGCMKVAEQFEKDLEDMKLTDKVRVVHTGCHGFCEQGPLVVFRLGKDQAAADADGTPHTNVFYPHVKPAQVRELIESNIQQHRTVDKLLYREPKQKQIVVEENDIPFYKHQRRLVFELNGLIDPTSIEDYISQGGYQALVKVFTEQDPEGTIDQIIKSGLRGRGGGGYPTGLKWKQCREAEGDPKYVICNADEGDPGAFMDRSVLEGNPHSVIEGMIIGSFAIGAHEGYIYVRNEYPLAVLHATIALEQAEKYGLLGDNILGTGHSFRIKINRGGGAFVCGESTALMASIEGFVGEPRAKHIHTVESGLFDKPTDLNNVETWANIPIIINRGVDWYTSIGTGDVSKSPWGGSKGTKIFSLVGKVKSTGLVEIPMGMTLREIVEDIGGGVKDGKQFKAVQTGGPSGGCLPASKLDLPVDFDQLVEAGSMMGSGGMIVMDEDNCMVDVARYFLDFLRGESCGKCVTCREGIDQMYRIVNRICEGNGRPGDIELLEELGETVKEGSLCALGQTAPNPVLSTLRYFREEYEAHIYQKTCPAHVCQGLIRYVINDNCNGCHVCYKRCPQQCITGDVKGMHVIDQASCIKCGICYQSCKFDAIDVLTGNEQPRTGAAATAK